DRAQAGFRTARARAGLRVAGALIVSAFQRVFSGAPWESRVGYCRALRAGDRVFVTGTTSVDPDGSVHAPGDAYAQTVRCFEIIRSALGELGAALEDVTRTRMFVTDIRRWQEYG